MENADFDPIQNRNSLQPIAENIITGDNFGDSYCCLV